MRQAPLSVNRCNRQPAMRCTEKHCNRRRQTRTHTRARAHTHTRTHTHAYSLQCSHAACGLHSTACGHRSAPLARSRARMCFGGGLWTPVRTGQRRDSARSTMPQARGSVRCDGPVPPPPEGMAPTPKRSGVCDREPLGMRFSVLYSRRCQVEPCRDGRGLPDCGTGVLARGQPCPCSRLGLPNMDRLQCLSKLSWCHRGPVLNMVLYKALRPR